MEKKIVIARLEIAEGKEKNFLDLVAPLIEGTRNENGNISYTLYQNPFNGKEFIFYEEYQDLQAVKVHSNTPHFQDFAKNVTPFLAKDMDIQTF